MEPGLSNCYFLWFNRLPLYRGCKTRRGRFAERRCRPGFRKGRAQGRDPGKIRAGKGPDSDRKTTPEAGRGTGTKRSRGTGTERPRERHGEAPRTDRRAGGKRRPGCSLKGGSETRLERAPSAAGKGSGNGPRRGQRPSFRAAAGAESRATTLFIGIKARKIAKNGKFCLILREIRQ